VTLGCVRLVFLTAVSIAVGNIVSWERTASILVTVPGLNKGEIVEFRSESVKSHVMWVPFHHGMARPQVADVGDALQFWRVAANILNKQSRTADKRCFSSLGLGMGLITPHRKKISLLRKF
jgi:hypothetical protein